VIVRAIDDYQPHAILLSSGFDAHRRDPLGACASPRRLRRDHQPDRRNGGPPTAAAASSRCSKAATTWRGSRPVLLNTWTHWRRTLRWRSPMTVTQDAPPPPPPADRTHRRRVATPCRPVLLPRHHRRSGGCWKALAIGWQRHLVARGCRSDRAVRIRLQRHQAQRRLPEAFTRATNDPRVIAALGTPIEKGWVGHGKVHLDKTRAPPNIDFPISDEGKRACTRGGRSYDGNTWTYFDAGRTPTPG